jgi:uncharacterized protein YggU (UPF0235/DUF167 family)
MAYVLTVKVVPGSGRSDCKLDKNGTLKIYLKSQAEGGRANEELLKMLAKALQVPYGALNIMTGATSRTKMIKIDASITHAQVLACLGIEKQIELFKQ